MIIGIGTDIMDVARIREAMENDPGLRDEIFTPNEVAYCESKTNKYEYYTARFAAKEAMMKALGVGWQLGLQFRQIEVLRDDLGKPIINLTEKAKDFAKEKGISKILVSLAHVKEYATAMVVVE